MMFDFFKSLDKKIKEDKDRLLAELKLADVRTLIMEMDNNQPISKSIIKKQKRHKSYGSEDFVSWFAYKVSDELNDPDLKPELIALLNEKKFAKYHQYVLRCLASLCVNTTDYELFDFLISQLKQSKDEEKITTVLSRLSKLVKPKTVNIDYLKELLIEGTYQNRIDALAALTNCEHDELELLLIQEFKNADQHTKCMICATLRTTGSERSFETLRSEYKRTLSNDLKYFIESAIDEIKKRGSTTKSKQD